MLFNEAVVIFRFAVGRAYKLKIGNTDVMRRYFQLEVDTKARTSRVFHCQPPPPSPSSTVHRTTMR
jgi:hypothetical protein